jgi:hypothetical protein
LEGHRTALILLMLAYALSMCDRMILSVLFPDIIAPRLYLTKSDNLN